MQSKTFREADLTQRIPTWRQDVDILYSEAEIQKRIVAMAAEITRDFTGKDVTAICILRGAFSFFSDLVRAVELPLLCEFMTLSSYGDAQTSSGEVQISKIAREAIEGRSVLIVEDIVDTGLSMNKLLQNLKPLNPRSLSVCTLLDKKSGRVHPVPVAYTGFDIQNAFVIGYGLDFRGYYRNLPFVGVYRGPT